MRNELVNAACSQMRNRFVVVHAATKITRAFHRPTKDRVQQTINDSLSSFADGKYLVLDGRLIKEGVPDLDTYNGITGEAQCSYVKPEYLTPAGELALAMETA